MSNGTNQQYFLLKAQYGPALLLFKTSDAYEMFNEDAQVTSKLLGLTLKRLQRNSAEPIPVVAFPHHQLNGYLERLVAAGHRVAVCEPTDKAPRGEPVTRIVTPAPKLVGLWVLGCNSQGDFVQWGLDGGTVLPFPPDQMDEAIAQARYVSESDRLLRICILNVFDNGQIRQDEFTGE